MSATPHEIQNETSLPTKMPRRVVRARAWYSSDGPLQIRALAVVYIRVPIGKDSARREGGRARRATSGTRRTGTATRGTRTSHATLSTGAAWPMYSSTFRPLRSTTSPLSTVYAPCTTGATSSLEAFDFISHLVYIKLEERNDKINNLI